MARKPKEPVVFVLDDRMPAYARRMYNKIRAELEKKYPPKPAPKSK